MVKIDKKIVGWEVVDQKEEPAGKPVEKQKRPAVLSGYTYKIKPPLLKSSLYITINNKDGRPHEIFINSKDSTNLQWTTALTLSWSALFRREKNLAFIVDDLKSISDPNGGYFHKGKYIPSLAAAIGHVLEEHLIACGLIEEKKLDPSIQDMIEEKKLGTHKGANVCPDCGGEVVRLDGCETCLSCGKSKCG